MNSFYTRDDSLQALERYPELQGDIPLDFLQGRIPKITDDDELRPVSWPADPSREWTPPGHGDLYTSLVTSGMLEALLEHGYEYAFMSNSDNLGAVLDPRILAWLAADEIPFLMEVTRRTDADRKGGHIALRDGRYLLRETAQTPKEDLSKLQDTDRHRYVNTNNLWLNLRALDAVMRERDGVLGLPMIVNRKTVDPSDSSSTPVIQLETAMGAAVGVFDGARALNVPRRRFSPVKTTEDLLGLRSDAYVLTEDAHVELAPERDGVPVVVDLDDDFFNRIRDFDARIPPADTPSLIACERISIVGDVAFGANVVVRGRVRIEQTGDEQLRIEDGTVLEG
jgi:UTP--glucose-1-phosphate uridylyltransferase